MTRDEIRIRLIQVGRDQRWLAQQLDVTPAELSRWLTGARRKPTDLDQRIERAFLTRSVSVGR